MRLLEIDIHAHSFHSAELKQLQSVGNLLASAKSDIDDGYTILHLTHRASVGYLGVDVGQREIILFRIGENSRGG